MKKNFNLLFVDNQEVTFLIEKFLKNNPVNVCRFRKKTYLCIAFETEV